MRFILATVRTSNPVMQTLDTERGAPLGSAAFKASVRQRDRGLWAGCGVSV